MRLTVLMNAGPWLAVPPAGYGGIETIVATLVPELRKLGVRVVLATVGASRLPADDHVRPLCEPRFDRVAAPYNQVSGITHAHMHDVVAYLRANPGVDVVHDHLEVVGPAVLGAMGEAAPPTLQTLHWDLRKHADFYERFDGRGRVAFAAVSQSQLDRAPKMLRDQTIGVVPLAVPPPPPPPPRPAPIADAPGRHVLVLARITRDKGQDISARVCRRAGVPLVLAGPVAGIGDPAELRRRLDQGEPAVTNHPDVRYFVEEVLPHLDGDRVRWVGGVAGVEKEQLLQSSRALLATIRWAEPGATGVIEALGRGIPVVATPMGVLPSLVEHGVTGLLGRTEDELTALLSDLDQIDPDACRASVAAWTPRAMAERYLELYETLLDRQGAR